MSRPCTHVQGLLPSVLAMKEEEHAYRPIANRFRLTKEPSEELCSRVRRKQNFFGSFKTECLCRCKPTTGEQVQLLVDE